MKKFKYLYVFIIGIISLLLGSCVGNNIGSSANNSSNSINSSQNSANFASASNSNQSGGNKLVLSTMLGGEGAGGFAIDKFDEFVTHAISEDGFEWLSSAFPFILPSGPSVSDVLNAISKLQDSINQQTSMIASLQGDFSALTIKYSTDVVKEEAAQIVDFENTQNNIQTLYLNTIESENINDYYKTNPKGVTDTVFTRDNLDNLYNSAIHLSDDENNNLMGDLLNNLSWNYTNNPNRIPTPNNVFSFAKEIQQYNNSVVLYLRDAIIALQSIHTLELQMASLYSKHKELRDRYVLAENLGLSGEDRWRYSKIESSLGAIFQQRYDKIGNTPDGNYTDEDGEVLPSMLKSNLLNLDNELATAFNVVLPTTNNVHFVDYDGVNVLFSYTDTSESKQFSSIDTRTCQDVRSSGEALFNFIVHDGGNSVVASCTQLSPIVPPAHGLTSHQLHILSILDHRCNGLHDCYLTLPEFQAIDSTILVDQLLTLEQDGYIYDDRSVITDQKWMERNKAACVFDPVDPECW